MVAPDTGAVQRNSSSPRRGRLRQEAARWWEMLAVAASWFPGL